jgi:hypothetical protein
VYLLGATLHEVLTGSPPHTGRTLADVLLRAYDDADRDYGDAPPELGALCREALRREAAARPPSARAFRDRLAAFLSHRAAAAILERGRERLRELGRTSASPEDRRALASRRPEVVLQLTPSPRAGSLKPVRTSARSSSRTRSRRSSRCSASRTMSLAVAYWPLSSLSLTKRSSPGVRAIFMDLPRR